MRPDASAAEIRSLRLTDIPDLAALTQSNHAYVSRFLLQVPDTATALIDYFTSAYVLARKGERWEGVVRLEGHIIGQVCLLPIMSLESRLWEAQGWLLPEVTHAGLGSRCLRFLGDEALRRGGKQVWGRILSTNSRSLRMVEASGFEIASTWPDGTQDPDVICVVWDLVDDAT